MVEIRNLTTRDMKQAIELKILCWTEELAGKCDNDLSISEELNLCLDWMDTAKENDDIRLLIGAFENENMLGIAFGSFAETYDILEKGIELNGLWVYPNQRGKGISLMLLNYMFDFYLSKGMEEVVIYNHHYAPSNKFYIKLGAKVLKQENQMDGKLLVDIFLGDIQLMKKNIEQSLKNI